MTKLVSIVLLKLSNISSVESQIDEYFHSFTICQYTANSLSDQLLVFIENYFKKIEIQIKIFSKSTSYYAAKFIVISARWLPHLTSPSSFSVTNLEIIVSSQQRRDNKKYRYS